MCLKVSDKRTEKFWTTGRRRDKSFIWAYKVYHYNLRTGNFSSIFYPEEFPGGIKYGKIISTRKTQKIGDDEYDRYDEFYEDHEVSRGIHVILSSQEAHNNCEFESDTNYSTTNSRRFVIVRVKCYKKDFVAVSNSEDSHAVFMKVSILRKDYRRIRQKFAKARKEYAEAIKVM